MCAMVWPTLDNSPSHPKVWCTATPSSKLRTCLRGVDRRKVIVLRDMGMRMRANISLLDWPKPLATGRLQEYRSLRCLQSSASGCPTAYMRKRQRKQPIMAAASRPPVKIRRALPHVQWDQSRTFSDSSAAVRELQHLVKHFVEQS